MLLFAYVPRPPSIATESMLRCAYRAGLRGVKLDGDLQRCKVEQTSMPENAINKQRNDGSTDDVDQLRDRGKPYGATTTSSARGEDGGVDRTQVVESARIAEDRVPSCDRPHERSTNVLHGGDGNWVGREGNCSQRLTDRNVSLKKHLHQTNMCLTNSSRGDTGGIGGESGDDEIAGGADNREKKTATKSQKIAPVLLAFRMSADTARIHGDGRTTDVGEETYSTRSDDLQQWMSEWRSMFPDVHFKSTQTEATATASTTSLSRTPNSEHEDEQERDGNLGIMRQGGHVDIDNTGCTWKELWGAEGEWDM